MKRTAVCLIICVSVLFAVGLLMVFNTTAAEIIDRSLDVSTHAALLKQVAYGSLGLVFGLIVRRFGYGAIIRASFPLLIMMTILLMAVFIPHIGQTINGARRWIGIGKISFQPSECAKILIPIYFIHWFLVQKEPIGLKPFLKVLGLILFPLGLILLEPDNGTTAIILSSLFVLFVLTKIRWTYWAAPLLIVLCLGAAIASQMPHVPDRIRIYLHPELDIRGKGHQPHQAKIAAGSGGLCGRGMGESLQKLNYLPEARSDYIAAIFAEEFGFVGILALIALYMTFTYAGFAIAMQAPDRGGFLLASVLTFLIAIQAFCNLGIVSGLLPSKGTTLPFFSQGGSSLVMNIISLFLLLDIVKSSRRAFV